MPATANLTALDAVLKQLYRNENYGEATYKVAPLTGLLPKFTGFVGKNMPIPIRYANPGGVSNTFLNAQSDSQASQYRAFELTRSKVYGTAKIDGETADASATDSGAFIKAITSEIDATMEAVTQKMESDLFRVGTGSIGTIGTLAGNLITLTNINNITNFEAGMTIRVSPPPDTFPAAANRAGQDIIEAVDRSAGTITSQSATWAAAIPAIAVNDLLMRAGDLNLAFRGLEAWLPDTVTATPFFGVDRTVDAVRLGGNRYDATSTGETVEEALIEGQGRAAREGGRPDTILMNNLDFRKLVKTTGSRIQYRQEYGRRPALGRDGAMADISFSSLRLQGDYGPMDIIPCPKCPQRKAYVLQMDTWSLNSVGTVPKILMRDGLRIQRIYNDDGYEVRVGGYGQMGCKHPGANAKVLLPL